VLVPARLTAAAGRKFEFGARTTIAAHALIPTSPAAFRAILEYGTWHHRLRTARHAALHEAISIATCGLFRQPTCDHLQNRLQANLRSSAACRPQGTSSLIDREQHAKPFTTPPHPGRRARSFASSSTIRSEPKALRKKLERLAPHVRNRLVGRGFIRSREQTFAPALARDRRRVPGRHARTSRWTRRFSGPYGRTKPASRAPTNKAPRLVAFVRRHVLEDRWPAWSAVCVSNPAELRALHFRARVRDLSSGLAVQGGIVSAAIKVVRTHPRLREHQLLANVRRCPGGFGIWAYVIARTESPIVPI